MTPDMNTAALVAPTMWAVQLPELPLPCIRARLTRCHVRVGISLLHGALCDHVAVCLPVVQLYWFTTYNTDRAGNAADGRPAPASPEEAKADALAGVAGWGGGVEAAIERTDVADITRNRIADRCGLIGARRLAIGNAHMIVTLRSSKTPMSHCNHADM